MLFIGQFGDISFSGTSNSIHLLQWLQFKTKFNKIHIRNGGSTALQAAYTVDTVNMVYTVDTVYTIETASHC